MPERRLRRLTIVWAIEIIVVTAMLRAVWEWLPDYRDELTHEHRAVEMASVYLYVVAALVGLASAWRWRASPAVTVVVPVLSLLGAMEEMSFVLRLGLTPPRLLNTQIDALSDLVEVVYRALTRSEFAAYAPAAAGVTLVVAFIAIYLLVRFRRQVWHGLQQAPWRFVLATGVLLASATLMDLGMVRVPPRAFWEETLELQAAATMVCAALACWWAPGEPWREVRAVAP